LNGICFNGYSLSVQVETGELSYLKLQIASILCEKSIMLGCANRHSLITRPANHGRKYDTATKGSLVGHGLTTGRSFDLGSEYDGYPLCGRLYFSHQYQFLSLGLGLADFNSIHVAQSQSGVAADSSASRTFYCFECAGN